MADLTFAQASRRNYTAPILIAVVLLAAIAAMVQHHFSGRAINTSITHTEVFPIRVVFKAQQQAQGFKVLSNKPISNDEGIYVFTTVHIENHIPDPLFLKDFHATLELPNGQLRTSAIEQNDIPAVTAALPELKPKLAGPLLRESTIASGQAAEGTVVLQFPITESTWNARKSAALTIDLYHQPSIVIAIPKP